MMVTEFCVPCMLAMVWEVHTSKIIICLRSVEVYCKEYSRRTCCSQVGVMVVRIPLSSFIFQIVKSVPENRFVNGEQGAPGESG